MRIQTERGQRIIDTGVYGFVRHPMYLGASLWFVGGALLLGSVCGLLVALAEVLLLVLRIFGEERLLAWTPWLYTTPSSRTNLVWRL